MPQIRFEPPSKEQLWSCLQRCLNFDEPAARWNKLLIHLSRHVAVKDLADLPLSTQVELFNRVFGPGAEETSRNFNIQLALEDLHRFTSLAFDTWYYSFPAEELAISQEIADLSRQMNLSEAQTAWLHVACSAPPDWMCLREKGPWAQHSVADFVIDVMSGTPSQRASSALIETCRRAFKAKLKKWRTKLPTSFQPEVLVLVEGPTEAVLLPRFARLLEKEFSNYGIFLFVCGGARQVERRYISFSDAVAMPIFVIIDGDATEEIKTISDILRPEDQLHAWLQGEIEDLLSKPFLIKQINGYLAHLGEPGVILERDVTSRDGRTRALNRLWRERGLGNFDKVGFAEFVAARMTRQDVPVEAASVISTLATVAGSSIQQA